MNNSTIKKSTLDFLKKLSFNNDRDWFNEHKDQYELAKENVEAFMDALILKMSAHDQLETPSGKKSLYRIYNDVRFSKDKAPYNPRFAGYLKRTKPLLRGGYYIRIKPGESRIACGFLFPNADDLKRIRQDITANYTDWKKLLNDKTIQKHFGLLQGEQVKTTPRGFSSDDPAIALIRYKQFWFERKFKDSEVIAADFLVNVNNSYKAIRPFFDYMSDLLTTDSNGESLY
ncbi:MAG TPA: DUF2461 domain-containing protein [Ohtaekwangia sp.]|uniref:DUF2461 domain-containing protein n=1 Tax=Ohtaekwangia sp. TaxID=2066019 RepID=UPI002F91C44A